MILGKIKSLREMSKIIYISLDCAFDQAWDAIVHMKTCYCGWSVFNLFLKKSILKYYLNFKYTKI